MLQLYGIVAVLLSVIAFLPYIIDIVTADTRPERASWLIWSVLSSISFFSQVAEGASLSLLFAGAQVAVTVFVFLLSIKRGFGRYFSKVNSKLYGISSIAVVTSFVFESAIYALVVSIVISLLGGSKTVLKAYKHPDTETLSTWIIALLASLFGLASVGTIDWVLMAYPLYLVLLYFAVTVALLAGRLAMSKRGRLSKQL